MIVPPAPQHGPLRQHPGGQPPAQQRFDRAPLMVYWELTRACDLACRHCRASASERRHPLELTREEGFGLLDSLVRFGDDGGTLPHLVLTGGDPLKRSDVYDLAARGVELGLQVSVTPSGTPLLTRAALAGLRVAGVRTVALSLDGSTAERHDRIRQVDGSFDRTVAAAGWAREVGLALQINSLVSRETADDLPAVFEVVRGLDADRWSVFFLVQIGRGAVLSQVGAEECERILEWLYGRTLESPRPAIKTTEAHHFRRVALQRQKGAAERGGIGPTSGSLPPEAAAALRRGFGIRDGAGIMFVSHTGAVYPSGFLPVGVGNVRTDDPMRLYREAPLFRQLRDARELRGKCRACEFQAVCGGSRSRAWAATGDPLAEDPLCAYQPGSAGVGWQRPTAPLV